MEFPDELTGETSGQSVPQNVTAEEEMDPGRGREGEGKVGLPWDTGWTLRVTESSCSSSAENCQR